MARQSQNRRARDVSGHDNPSIDLVVRWSGGFGSRRHAFAELSVGSSPQSVGFDCWLFRNVRPRKAFRWLIRHLWEGEIESPQWVRQWVGEWLLQRGRELAL